MPNRISHTSSSVQKRTKRVRSKLVGTAVKPRVTVFRSNRHIAVQAIDDQTRTTLAYASDHSLVQSKETFTKTQRANQVGIQLAQSLQKGGISQAIFDRGPYRYHGRVRAVAEALRKEGVQV